MLEAMTRLTRVQSARTCPAYRLLLQSGIAEGRPPRLTPWSLLPSRLETGGTAFRVPSRVLHTCGPAYIGLVAERSGCNPAFRSGTRSCWPRWRQCQQGLRSAEPGADY